MMMTADACLKKNSKTFCKAWKILDHCSWPREIMMVSLKCMVAGASLETIRLK